MRSFYLLLCLSLTSSALLAKNITKTKPSFMTIWADEFPELPDEKQQTYLALEKCVEQTDVYVKEKLGESSEYVDYVVSKVVVMKQYDSWQKKKPNGKFVFGSKVECGFTVKLLKEPLKSRFN